MQEVWEEQLIFHSLWRRTNAQNISFTNSLMWPIYNINLVDETKLSSHWHSTTVSLETYPFHSVDYAVWSFVKNNKNNNDGVIVKRTTRIKIFRGASQ